MPAPRIERLGAGVLAIETDQQLQLGTLGANGLDRVGEGLLIKQNFDVEAGQDVDVIVQAAARVQR